MTRCSALALVAAAALAGCGGDGGTPTPQPLTREQAVREAVRITGAAQLEVMRSVRPGMREADLKAIVDRVFEREGADALAFPHIVATGAHAVDAHYSGGDGILSDGELVVIDIGAVRDGWASDLTRTVPVSGHFSSRQRELYGLALDGQELAVGRARTGVHSLREMQGWVVALYQASPLSAVGPDGAPATLDRFNPWALGHYMGHDVHGSDTGWDPRAPLAEGQALTVEPGMYVASEGLGLRIEDDYWVTALGLECLSCAVPRWPDEIEAAMAAALPPVAGPPLPPASPLPVSPYGLARPHMER